MVLIGSRWTRPHHASINHPITFLPAIANISLSKWKSSQRNWHKSVRHDHRRSSVAADFQRSILAIILTLLTWTPKDSSIYLLELLEKFVDHLGGINLSSSNTGEQRTISMTLPSDIIDRATEVVKNLQNIFDKLFEILTSQENELKTREQEQFAIAIDLNRIHQTAFHALVSGLRSIALRANSSFASRSASWIWFPWNNSNLSAQYSMITSRINSVQRWLTSEWHVSTSGSSRGPIERLVVEQAWIDPVL